MKGLTVLALSALSVKALALSQSDFCPALVDDTDCSVDYGCGRQTQFLSDDGFTCAGNNLLSLSDAVGIAECASTVDSNTNCSATFVYSEDTKACGCNPVSDTCVVAASRGTRVVQIVDPYCVCYSEPDSDDKVGKGDNCGTLVEASDFVIMLNTLNELVNNGEVYTQTAVAATASSAGRNHFTSVTLASSAVLLDRGFDGEISLQVALDDETQSSTWLSQLETGMLDALTNAGQVITASQIRPLEDPTNVTIVSEVTTAAATTSTTPATTTTTTLTNIGLCPCFAGVEIATCNQTCYFYEVAFILTETRVLEDWELGLIIAACVLFVCALAVGLSAAKTPIKEPVIVMRNNRDGDAEKGVEMTQKS